MAIVKTAQAVIQSLFPPKSEERDAAFIPMDDQAFHVFYSQSAASLRAYVARVLGNAAHAEDIAQESYLRIVRKPPAMDNPRQLRAYLFRVASNLIVDHWRSQKLEKGQAAASETRQPDNIPLRVDMERLFEQLRPQERQMMWLAHVEGFDHCEIAATLGLRERSVRVMLHRTRSKLARLIREGESGGGGRK